MNKEVIDKCCDALLDSYQAASVIYTKDSDEFIILYYNGLEIIYASEAALDVVEQIKKEM